MVEEAPNRMKAKCCPMHMAANKTRQSGVLAIVLANMLAIGCRRPIQWAYGSNVGEFPKPAVDNGNLHPLTSPVGGVTGGERQLESAWAR